MRSHALTSPSLARPSRRPFVAAAEGLRAPDPPSSRGPGVHPMDAEGILVAKVLDFADEGHCYVAPFGSKFHIVSGALLTPTLIDGPTALFRAAEPLHVARA